ncbi:hypothetical protein GTP44_17355 [Duganella sp. FT50W]|uniref:Uncharacterized protein n=1 Tax=Duganella lactea TaxID=2692173 RepID=A0A6L8MQY4_9BURK|nr:hypothetical protein [Duganella lactea]MYM83708.1 hypothetical protein [Duganella lactea]
MTSSDQKTHDDELDDFLAGRDALSRQLAALPQPESPKQVDDAVMAAIEARVAQEQAAQATQLTPVAPRRTAAANMARWRAPAALAASMVCALLLTLEWQRGDDAAPAPAPAAEPPQTAPAPPPPPPAKQPTLAQAPASTQPAVRHRPAAKHKAPVQAESPVIATPAPANAPMADHRSLADLPFIAQDVAAPPAPPAPAPALMPAPAPITVTGYARRAEPAVPVTDDARAAEWLNVISEMLKAGLRRDALQEWRKFHQAYPNYPVPDDIARQIAAID